MAEGEKRIIGEPVAAPKIEQEKKPRDGSKTFTLTDTILAHGESLAELKVREPRASDIMRVGTPVVMRPLEGGGIQMAPDAKVMTAMMVELAAVPPSSIGQMAASDWMTIATWLASFFAVDWAQVMS